MSQESPTIRKPRLLLRLLLAVLMVGTVAFCGWLLFSPPEQQEEEEPASFAAEQFEASAKAPNNKPKPTPDKRNERTAKAKPSPQRALLIAQRRLRSARARSESAVAEQAMQAEGQARELARATTSEALDGQTEALVGQRARKKSKKNKKRPKSKIKFATLEVVTDFGQADVKVNGRSYPEYLRDEELPGILLPAGGPHLIEVVYKGKIKNYQVFLRPNETRLLIVELTGFNSGGSAPAPTKKVAAKAKPKKKKEDDKNQGRITVYSKPKAEIYVDGKPKGEKTPNTVDTEPGKHEVQVKYEESNEMSEKKIVRVRKGSRIKLFFREKGRTSVKK